MADSVKKSVETKAKDEIHRVKGLTADAVRSGAYLYPVKGLFYFLSHRSLWRPLTAKLVPMLSLGMGITSFMFTFTYLPQAAALTLIEGPLAPLSTVLLVLSESATLLNVISKSFVIEDSLIDAFDGTLLSKDMANMVSEGRTVRPGADAIAKLGKIIKKPFGSFSPTALVRYFMYLPLNFIPVVGTVMFILLQAKRFGPLAHKRYFQLKGWSSSQQDDWIERHRGAYTSFGVPAVLLEMVPIIGVFFTYTNAVGAALWAADLEQQANRT